MSLACRTGLALFALTAALPAEAATPRLVLDTAQRTIDIRSGFTGVDLMVFGAIVYPGGTAPRKTPDLAIVVEGPLQSISMREKEKLAGLIWVNGERNDFRSVPGYYGIASSRPLEQLIDRKTADIYQLGLDHIYLSPTGQIETRRIRRFQDGLIDKQRRKRLYVQQPGTVEISQKILYRTRMPLPADVPVGQYRVSAYLIEDGRVLTVEETRVVIDKTGFERLVTIFATQYSVLYGLLAVAVSLGLGWLGGTVLRKD